MGLFLAAKHAQTRQVCLVFLCKLYASLRFGGVKKKEAVIQPSSTYRMYTVAPYLSLNTTLHVLFYNIYIFI